MHSAVCCFIVWIASVYTSFAEIHVVERIAFGSCFNPNKGGVMWNLIDSFSPQQLILLGDQFYADMTPDFKYRKTKLEILIKEYSTFSTDADWRHLLSSLNGWTATFDDHDYGINNGDKTFRLRNESQDLFWKFTGASSVGFNNERKSGVYSSKTVRVPLDKYDSHKFTYKIIMLDSRSNKDRAGLRGDFLGNEQWEWLVGELLDSEPQLFIIGSSIQVLPDDKLVEETWNEFPHSRTRLLKLLTAVKQNSPHRQDVLILSGDIHSAEISQAKLALSTTLSDADDELYNLVELTCSGLSHTFTHTTVLSNSSISQFVGTKPSVQVQSRGMTKEIFYGLYQALYPAQYRELKFADFYSGIHFGLLDIILEPLEGSHHQPKVSALFRVIDHRGEAVVTKVIPLHTGSMHSAVGSDMGLSLQQMSSKCNGNVTLLLETLDRETHLHCEAHWGNLPRYKLLLFKCAMALAGLVCVMLPCLAVLWLLFAGVYRLSRGHDDSEEALRRGRIEEVCRILSVQNAKKAD